MWIKGNNFSALFSSSSDPIRVLLVDDRTMVRHGLRRILEQYDNIQVVGEASHGREAVDIQRALLSTVVVMDVNMPVMDGIQATGLIMASSSPSYVIGIFVRNDREIEPALQEVWATECVTKEFASDQLNQTICRVVQGEKIEDPFDPIA